MFVDSGLLHSGGGEIRSAGEHAHQAATHLSGGILTTHMFGDFAAAAAFHNAAGSARDHHVRILLDHRETLDAVGNNTQLAAATFTDMEEHNAKRVQAVRCTFAT
ncbi:DUF2563 family protein [Mycobacterium vicinigordonae]|uniref:DUF2563 family protein n=1 Tax=Mycobacterium vicinigordonae TaxID=1719132 RepID=A0A7D6HR96_9MYCO|nr:DUF2563 family protein [Mycobacterium vicinigordonae]QLL05452.1 DUF2563 family protein [Mycobacterium vicinigordonae]